MFLELFISLGKWLCFIFLPSFQWQNRSWQRNRTERQHRNLNHLLNYHFHSSFSANLEIGNGGGIQLLQHTRPRRQKQQAVKDCVPEQLSSSPRAQRPPHLSGWLFSGAQSPAEVEGKDSSWWCCQASPAAKGKKATSAKAQPHCAHSMEPTGLGTCTGLN